MFSNNGKRYVYKYFCYDHNYGVLPFFFFYSNYRIYVQCDMFIYFRWRLPFFVNLFILCSNVDDIDVFAGGVAETPDDGAAVGPLFSCIIGNQFRDFKDGDRYWYERRGVEGFSRGKKHLILLSSTDMPGHKIKINYK